MKPSIYECDGEPSKVEGFEFYFQPIDTLVLVQNRQNEIIIRATEETFSERKKQNFIHELAMEGFIPDEYRSFQIGSPGVHWIRDRSWLRVDEVAANRTRLLMTRVALASGLLWIFMMIALCAHGALPTSRSVEAVRTQPIKK